ncbi:hypothetical protein ACLOJK_027797 [Asimina triloba]
MERRAFLFCREDRAILCRECDLPIHTANELTKKHNRFLLTGVKLSHSSLHASALLNCNEQAAAGEVIHREDDGRKALISLPAVADKNQEKTATDHRDHDVPKSQELESCTSSISEYLIKMLPGWHVEDFLDSSADGVCKTTDNMFPFLDDDFETDPLFGSNNLPILVPQFPPYVALASTMVGAAEFKGSSRKYSAAAGVEVPQLCPPAKRSRSYWHMG